MKKTFLKITWFIILFFTWLCSSFAFTSNELITLYSDSPDTWESLYIVPDWYDLVVNRMKSSDLNEEISLRNSTGATLAVVSWKEEYLWWELVIKDDLQIISTPATNVDILIFWFLVHEDEDIQYYLQWNSNAWNKNIFTKEDIDFIYFREFILFIFVMVMRFFEFIIWRRLVWKFM